MKEYKHIFWDLDHTLWDFEKNSIAALQEMYVQFKLNEKGITDFDAFNIAYHIHNDKYWERFRKGFITRQEMRWKRMFITLMDYKINDQKLAIDLGEAYLQLLPLQKNVFDGAIDILDYCANKGYQQHMITNGFEETQIQKMKNTNLHHYFSELITSEKAMSMKPHAEIFQYAFAKTNSNCTEGIMIGDAIDVDVLGAMQVKMDGVWFNPNGLISNQKRTFEIKQLLELKTII